MISRTALAFNKTHKCEMNEPSKKQNNNEATTDSAASIVNLLVVDAIETTRILCLSICKQMP